MEAKEFKDGDYVVFQIEKWWDVHAIYSSYESGGGWTKHARVARQPQFGGKALLKTDWSIKLDTPYTIRMQTPEEKKAFDKFLKSEGYYWDGCLKLTTAHKAKNKIKEIAKWIINKDNSWAFYMLWTVLILLILIIK